MNKLEEISPKALLATVFALSLSPFSLVALFPSWFHRTMDIASYLVFHNIAEFFSVMVALSIFGVAWFTYEQSRDRHALFLGCAFLAIGLMDFLHTLGYAGMPAFITPNSPLKSTQFWIAVRMYSALAFLASGYVHPGSPGRLLSKGFLLASAVAVSGVVFTGVIYFPSYLPVTIIEGQGVTPFKRYSEYLIMLLFALSIPVYWKRYADTGRRQLLYFMAALIVCIFSELAFSGYKSVFDSYNVLGHIYKLVAFTLIYWGIFIASVKFPYLELSSLSEQLRTESEERKRAEELLRTASSYNRRLIETSLDPLVTIGQDGKIADVNTATETATGYSRSDLVGTDFSDYFTDPEKAEAGCKQVFTEGLVRDYPLALRHRDGHTTDVLYNASIYRNEKGQIAGVFAAARDITERKKMEDVLRAKEEQLREAQHVGRLGSWEWDATTDTIIWSDEYYRIYGIDPELPAPGYLEHLKAYTPGSSARLDAVVKKATQTGEPYEIDLELADPGNRTRWICARGGVIGDAGGRIVGLRGTAQDITERKQTEEKLRQSERFNAIMARIATVFLTVPDEEVFGEVLKVVLEVMESRLGIFGFIANNGDLVMPSLSREVWSECQVPDKSIVFPPHTWGGSLWGRAIREKKAFYSNNPFHTPEGHLHIYNFLAVPVLFGDKTIGLLSVANKDGGYTEEDKELQESITNRISPILSARLQRDSQERQRADAEGALKSLAHRISLILDSAAEGIYGTDLDGKVTFANPAAAQMLGYEVEELLGRSSHATWHHSYPDGTPFLIEQCQLHHVLRKGIPCVTTSVVFWRKDGTKFPVDCSSTPMFEAGKLIGAVVIFRDIEEKTRLENQLRQAQKMEAIGTLAGGVAHNYNNLTTIVLAYADMLLGELPPDDPARKHVDQIVKAGERSAALTRQLLAFSRKQPLQPVVLDLSALLSNYEKMLGPLIGEDIRLEFRLPAEAGCVKADPGQLEQIVTNLVTNARDAMPRGGRLTIETAAVELDETQAPGTVKVVPGRYVRLTVTDTGVGMDPATLARVFEPFFTTKEKGKGTGLGLATAYGIVKQSGGYIWAASEPGKGTTFTIYLPRTDAKPHAGPIRGVVDAPCGGNGERILLVEDEAALREWCETALTRLGYRVSTAANGREALDLVLEQWLEPDLVVTDLVMPEMSGFELADRLREKRPDLGVLYMSGYPDETIARHGVIASDMFFLSKPFSERDLAQKVHEALAAAGTGGPPARRPRRVLMIDDDEQYRELVRHFCTRRGHPFAGVDSAVAALAALAAQPCDVLLVDLNIPGTSGEHVLREIRAAGHDEPAIVLTGDVASADMDVLRPLGVVRALEKSSNAEPLLRAIEEEDLA